MLPKPIILILLNVDGCMHVAGGVVVSSDGGRGVVVGGVGSGVVVAGAHMSGFMTHLQHESKRCLQQTSDPLQRKKSHVQSAEIKLKLSKYTLGRPLCHCFVFSQKFWLPIGLHICYSIFQRPMEHVKNALQNIMTERTPQTV